MSGHATHNKYGADRACSRAACGDDDVAEVDPLPADFVELIEFRSIAIDHKLGYFGSEPVVIFGYCPGGGEVIWRDGHTSGFAAGGWRVFLEEISPWATRVGANLGGPDVAGTHVLLRDRRSGALYAAPREAAEDFLSQIYGIPRPTRKCMCALMDCMLCPNNAESGRGDISAGCTSPLHHMR